MTLIDALCHLELYGSLEAADAACARAAARGVAAVVSAGTDPCLDERVPAGSLAVHRAFGIHPQHADDGARPAQLRALGHKLDQGPCVALGECGLDARGGHPPLDVQERTFRAQLQLARERQLPVLLHVVRAHARALDILEEHCGRGPLPAGGVWHAFSGPAEAVDRALRLGLFLSVGALALNPGARRLRGALPKIPSERLLVETDAPHATLDALPDHLEAMAALRGVSVEELARTTSAAARAAYRLP